MMHLAFLYLANAENFSSPAAYAGDYSSRQQLYTRLRSLSLNQISHVQRAAASQSGEVDGIGYYFIKDTFGASLRWWQEPVPALEMLTQLKPDIILVAGLNLPLNFRWLRRLTGSDVMIIGHHTGETIWPSRNLWLQQFGLRVVDAFIFQEKEESLPWKKASVILPRQPIYCIPSIDKANKETAEQFRKIFVLLSGKS
jgi:hypothetical protein